MPENETPAEGTEARASTPGDEGSHEPPGCNTRLAERQPTDFKLRPLRDMLEAVQDVLDARDHVPKMDGCISVMLQGECYAPRLIIEM